MRGRIVLGSLCASVLLSLVASPAHALNPRVKIIRGDQVAATPAAAKPALPMNAPRNDTDESPFGVAPASASIFDDSEPNEARSPNAPAPPKERDPYSLVSLGSGNSLIDESNWGADAAPTSNTTSAKSNAQYDDALYNNDEYTSGCGGDSCNCDSCDGGTCDGSSCNGSGCSACCMPFGLSAGVEATYLNPGYEGSNSGLDLRDDLGYQAAPRLWLAWQNRAGWGIRGRYWDFDADQQRSFTANEPDDIVFVQSFDDDLSVYAVDLELTRTFFLGGIEGCASFGARHARFQRNLMQQISIFDVAGGGSDDASAILQDFSRDLNGTGITMGLGFRRPIAGTRLAAICNLRGSVLWGGNDLRYNLTVAEVVPVGAGDLDLNDFDTMNIFGSNSSAMWVGELQAGGEWNTPLSNAAGAGNAFVRVLFEGQWWNLPGVTASDDDFSTNDQLYDFLGVTAAVGFTR